MIKTGSKYYPLFNYLQASAQSEVVLTFSEIEVLLGSKLPSSAQRRAWWSNRNSPSALQAAAWIEAGYHTEQINLDQQTVVFRRFNAHYEIQEADGQIVWNRSAIRALRTHLGLTQADFAAEMGVRQQTVSEWENGVYTPSRAVSRHLSRVAESIAFMTQVVGKKPSLTTDAPEDSKHTAPQ